MDFYQKKRKKRLVLGVVVGVDVEVEYDSVLQEGVVGHPEGRVLELAASPLAFLKHSLGVRKD